MSCHLTSPRRSGSRHEALLDTHVLLWWLNDDPALDPFDRMLVAQARVEKLTLLTRDPVIRQYDVPTLLA